MTTGLTVANFYAMVGIQARMDLIIGNLKLLVRLQSRRLCFVNLH